MLIGGLDNFLNFLFSNIARIDPDSIDILLDSHQRIAMIEMDIGNQRNVNIFFNFSQYRSCFLIRHSHPDNFTACLFEGEYLSQRLRHVARIRTGHRLDNNRCFSPNQSITDPNPLCLSSFNSCIQWNSLHLFDLFFV
ncbi:MAG: hypothetical protein A4E66_01406 [Syntrophus sp. PtaB.Bin001]|nr:MAG: hypothetical protein A4E66_01406 [Syntrophus sp. PtaB.Bin001]